MEPILKVINVIKNTLDLSRVSSVLDLGCSSFLARPKLYPQHDILYSVFNGKEIVGIDLFEKDVEWRKINGPKGVYLCMNLLDYDFNKHHDVILCHHTLEHLTKDAHDVVFNKIEKATYKYSIIGGPIGCNDNSSITELTGNVLQDHISILNPNFYENSGYSLFLFESCFLAIKEK